MVSTDDDPMSSSPNLIQFCPHIPNKHQEESASPLKMNGENVLNRQ